MRATALEAGLWAGIGAAVALGAALFITPARTVERTTYVYDIGRDHTKPASLTRLERGFWYVCKDGSQQKEPCAANNTPYLSEGLAGGIGKPADCLPGTHVAPCPKPRAASDTPR